MHSKRERAVRALMKAQEARETFAGFAAGFVGFSLLVVAINVLWALITTR